MKHVLVTGVAGFIGSHTTQALLHKGYRVSGIDDLNDYYNPRWKEQNIASLVSHPQFSFTKLDITHKDELTRYASDLENVDVLLHLAARAGVRPSIQNPTLYTQVNIQGTQYLLDLARHLEIPHVVFASSSSVYGNQTKTPFSESDPVDEPISPYAATKKAGELLCHTYHHLYGISCTALRFFTVYGPGGRPDMAPYLFTKAALENKPIKKFGDGTSRRDYTYIDDIVSGVVAAVDTPLGYEVINLGNTTPVTLNDFISTLEAILEKEIVIEQHPAQPGDVSQTCADISKATKLLGFTAKTDFATGLRNFVMWYQSNRL